MNDLIREIHRRSLWQVLGIYGAASWGVLQVVEVLTNSVGLPDWTPAMALVLLLIGKSFNIPFIPVINGTCRWIRIGIGSKFIQLQPSEFCKIAYIVALAWYLRFRKNYRHLSGLIGPFTCTLLAMILILFEPDLGTVLLMMPVLFAMLFVAGAKVKHLMIIILLAILISPMLWKSMNPYQ